MNKNALSILKNALFGFSAAALIFLVWAVSAAAADNPALLPSPAATAKAAVKILDTHDFWVRLFSTLKSAVFAFLFSFLAAASLSLLSAKQTVRKLISPVITVIRALPTLAMVLIFLVWLSVGVIPVAITMLVMLPTLFSTYNSAVDSVPRELIETARVYGAGPVKTMLFVYIPHLTPTMIESCASGLSLSLKLVVSAEILAYAAGSIGVLMQLKQNAVDTVGLIAIAAMIALICVAVEFFIRLPLRAFKR